MRRGVRAACLDESRTSVLGLRDIQSIVATEKARIAYLQANPGSLPRE